MTEAPAALRPVQHRPDPQERPNSVEREQADPAGYVDGILVRVVASAGNLVGHVMDGDDPVKQRNHHEDQKPECEIIEEGVEIDALLVDGDSTSDDEGAQDKRRKHPFGDPDKG